MHKLITTAAACLLGSMAMLGTAAQAQDKKVRVQMGGAYPSTLAIIGPAQIYTAERIKKISGGSIDVKFFEPGALVPSSQYLDAVGNGSVDMAWSSLGFFTGKDIAMALFASVPFGPDIGEYVGWYKFGGGEQLMDEISGKYNVVSIVCGTIAPEASGWFRKEIKTVDDLKGLKMRFFGLGANVMQKLGVATQLLQPGEIFQALQLGTIDATEFSMPALDLSMGLHQVAKHYYFPGWHQLSSMQHLLISKTKWAEFSDAQKEAVRAACDQTTIQMLAEGESKQVAAIKEIQTKGVTIHTWSPEIIAAMRKAWGEVVEEQKAKSPEFKRVWESMQAYREQYKVWAEIGRPKN